MTANVRHAFLQFHRWAGLLIAGFLIVAGLTGAVISWDHELDDLLNSDLTKAVTPGSRLPPLDLARRIEAQDQKARVTYVPLQSEPGDSLAVSVDARVDPSSREPYELGYNQVFFDPVTGQELGRRDWGKPALTRENFVPFLYVLHYSLHLPTFWGIDRWGIWLMGAIALIWTIDCFVGFYLTLPRRTKPPSMTASAPDAPTDADRERDMEPSAVGSTASSSWWQRWKPAWRIKWDGSGRRINFDLHRATGLWLWAFLFVLALSAMSLNLYTEVAQPLVSAVSDFTPSPYDLRTPRALNDPIEPAVTFADVLARARAEGARRGWTEPVGALSYASLYGVYAAQFFEPGGDHGTGGVGPNALYFDGADGRYLGDYLPWTGTAGDLFLQLQFPVHSGRVAGIPGRIFISLMGLAVALLSGTGVVIWWQKRSASQLIASRRDVARASREAVLTP
jgi:uncharacterized iron-regulated membrane protein